MFGALSSPEALVERDIAMRQLAGAVAGARAGAGRFVLVEGAAGIGKSTLLGWAGQTAAASGMRVLRARAGVLERDFAFGVTRQLFERAVAGADTAERAALLEGPAEIAGRLLELDPAGQADAMPSLPESGVPFAMLHGLYWLTANVARRQPVCMLVDDAHWADPPSLRFLAFLLSRVDGLPVSLLVAARPHDPGAAAAALAALREHPRAELLEPQPLSADGVARLLHADTDPALIAACHRLTRGNPFLVSELARSLRDGRVAPSRAAIPRVEALAAETAGRWFTARLVRLPAEAGQLARAVAVLETADPADAAALAGLPPDAAAAAADRLAADGILAPGPILRFAHPLGRAGVYDSLPAGERDAAHRHAAALLAERDAPTERVAGHLLATRPAADAWTVDRLAAAARAAALQGAPDSAASYIRRALAEPPTEDARSPLLLELGAAQANLGEERAAETLRAAVAAARTPQARVGASLVLAHTLLGAERYAEAVRVLDRAAADLAPDDPAAAHLEVLTVGVAIHATDTATLHRDRIAALRRSADEAAGPSRELLAAASFVAVFANEREASSAFARRALCTGENRPAAPTDLPWFNQAAVSLLWCEQFDEVLPILDAAIGRARATGDAALFAATLAYRGHLVLRRGDLAGAEADARAALEADDLPAPSIYRTLNAGVLATAQVERDRLAAAIRELDAFASVIEQPAGPNAYLRLVRARVALAGGRLGDALADARAVGEVAEAIGARSPGVLPWRSVAALAHRALGEPEAAEPLATDELALAREFGGPRTLGVALRTAGLVLGGDEGEALLREAVATLGRVDARIEHGWALFELGAALRRSGRRREARALLEEAVAIGKRTGALRLRRLTEEELTAAGAAVHRDPIESRSRLTASELRAARHAAAGMTNRAIAQALFVTEKTIEVHLSSAYRKLDIGTRAELPAALAAYEN